MESRATKAETARDWLSAQNGRLEASLARRVQELGIFEEHLASREALLERSFREAFSFEAGAANSQLAENSKALKWMLKEQQAFRDSWQQQLKAESAPLLGENQADATEQSDRPGTKSSARGNDFFGTGQSPVSTKAKEQAAKLADSLEASLRILEDHYATILLQAKNALEKMEGDVAGRATS